MKRRLLLSSLLLALLALATCGYFYLGPLMSKILRTTSLPSPVPTAAMPENTDPVIAAIMRSANYIVNAQYPNGKFVYLAYPSSSTVANDDYNLLRHAGTIYSLGLYHKFNNDSRVLMAMKKGAKYLRNYISPVPEQKGILALWSGPDVEAAGDMQAAKLGGAGLGLVALLSLESICPGETPLATIQSLGEFILWMQKPDGSYFSRYIPEKGGRDPSWTSLYYPGEAALGLVMLFEADGNVKWLNSAALALTYLANIRKNRHNVEADHWALLATNRLLNHYDKLTIGYSRPALITHMLQIVNSMINEQQPQLSSTTIKGCFTSDGRTCPTATRIEGLLAALPLLPKEDAVIRLRMETAINAGVGFLMASQNTNGRLAGGFPLSVLPEKRANRRPDQSDSVRIDYVQHAMSGLIMFANSKSLTPD